MKKFISITAIFTIILLNLNGCGGEEKQPDGKLGEGESLITEEDLAKVKIPEAEASSFAQWEDVEAKFTPKIPAYTIESDLSNVLYTDIVDGPDGSKEKLAENGFVVVADYNNEFFSVYEDNRYEYTPSFVTTDSVLHTYHLYFDFLLKSLETNELYDLAYSISEEMQKISVAQYEELKGTEWQTAAKRNIAYFTVAMQLLDDGESEIPAIVKDEVEAELALIAAHQGIDFSPTIGMDGLSEYREDYSQYIPRGHYTKSDQLKRYFKAMMWYGRVTFRIKQGDETRSALLIVSALKNSDDIRNDWKALYEPINFFVGESDDLVYLDYAPLAVEIFGDSFADGSFTKDYINVGLFVKKAKELRDPGINSMPVLGTILKPEQEGVGERTEEVKGYRFMGQRFTIDAFIFQKLICREVGNKDGTMPCPAEDSRMLPKGLDIPSAFGSDLAYELLEEMGETEYEKYPENMKKLQGGMAKLPKSQWTQNAYWGWLYTLESLLDDYEKGYPMFMQNDEWKKKELITFLGSWAELKHDTILYAKQVYAELGGGPMIEERDDRGYVEPNPELYARLAGLTQLTINGLSERDILSEKNEEQLGKLKELLITLKDISIKELQNEALTDEEYEFIKTFGGSLEHFWYETFTEEEQDSYTLLDDNPAPLVADVATDPNGFVLEVATGMIDEIFVVFPIDGELRVGRGGVFSYYEFPWPMSDRLTDEKWRDEIMFSEDMPERPDWQTYVSEYE